MAVLLDTALFLSARGFRLFPLVPGGKTPAVKQWRDVACRYTGGDSDDEKAVFDLFCGWWGAGGAGYNIGLVTGGREGLLVIDVDVKNGAKGHETMAFLEAENGFFGRTMCVETPTGGWHYYLRGFRSKNSVNRLGPGIDTRGEGGYVVAPGSVINGGAGGTYVMRDGFTEDPVTAIAECPEWIKNALVRYDDTAGDKIFPGNRINTLGGATSTGDVPYAVARAVTYLHNTAPLAIQGDGGDHVAYRVACVVKDFGVPQTSCLALMLDLWNDRCSPPWPPEDLSCKIENAYKYGTEPPGGMAPDNVFSPVEIAGGEPENNRTVIQYRGADLDGVVPQIMTVLAADTSPDRVLMQGVAYVSVYPRRPVTVRDVRDKSRNLGGVIRRHDKHSLRLKIMRVIELHKWNNTDEEWRHVICPMDVVDAVLSDSGGALPSIAGIVDHPVIRTDGSLLDTPGYDDQTGLYATFDPDEYTCIPMAPTEADALGAIGFIIGQVFDGFPFASDMDCAVAVAALLTGFAQKSISGEVPGFLFSAPTQATGKTALAGVILCALSGKQPPATSWPWNEEEMGKTIVSVLGEGQSGVLFDNIRAGKQLESAKLASAMTSGQYSTRILGGNDMAHLSTNVLWTFTGNNVVLAGDMVSRVMTCYLDAKTGNPEKRRFTRPGTLTDWMYANRSRVVISCLTILLYGRCVPVSENMAPSRFSEWDAWVRHPILALLGDDIATVFDDASDHDPISNIVSDFIQEMHNVFGNRKTLARDILIMAQSGEKGTGGLRDAIMALVPSEKTISSVGVIKLGRALKTHVNKGNGVYNLKSARDPRSKQIMWCVEKTRG